MEQGALASFKCGRVYKIKKNVGWSNKLEFGLHAFSVYHCSFGFNCSILNRWFVTIPYLTFSSNFKICSTLLKWWLAFSFKFRFVFIWIYVRQWWKITINRLLYIYECGPSKQTGSMPSFKINGRTCRINLRRRRAQDTENLLLIMKSDISVYHTPPQ